MKIRLVIVIVICFFAKAFTFAQETIDKSYGERLLKVYFSSELFENEFYTTYHVKPFEFKFKNKSFFYKISSEILEGYKEGNFSFDTIHNYVFNELSKQHIDFNLLSREDLGVPSSYTNRAPGQPCINTDFEECSFNNWETFYGKVDGNPYGYVNVSPGNTGNDVSITTGAGTDGIGGFPVVNPDGGTCSAMVGDGPTANYDASSIRQTWLVDATNSSYTYSYAAALEDAGHTPGDQPFFIIRMTDASGGSIGCGDYNVTAGDGSPGWVTSGGWVYKPWTTVFIPLDAYVGQNVSIEFIVGDCNQGAHSGYAYVDASCSPMQIVTTDTIVCPGNPITLSAPPGGASYLWSTGETTQSISVATGGNYSVSVTSVTGCVVNLSQFIYTSASTPVASFSASSVCVGTSSSFTDQSFSVGGITNWNWDFDNNGTVESTTQSPSNLFAAAGTYPVNLSVTNADGCTDDTTINVLVNDVPVVNFTSDFVCEGTATQFTDLTTLGIGSIASWAWDFDSNGSTDNSAQNPLNGFSGVGNYNTTLTVTTNYGCTGTVSNPVVVNPVPNANFTAMDVCLGQTMNFTDGSTIQSGAIANWSWDFGDGSGTSNVQNPQYLYQTANTYNVQLTVTSDSGCIDNVTLPVAVQANPTAGFTVTDVCDQSLVTLTDNSSGNGGVISSWYWDVESNGSTDYTTQNPTFVYTSDGSYTVQLIVETQEGCRDTVSNPVVVYPTPVADYTFAGVCEGDQVSFVDNSSISSGNIATWSWDFANGNTSGVQSPVETYPFEGNYNVNLTVTSNNGCVHSINQMVPIYPLPSPLFVGADVCLGSSVGFFDVSSVSNNYTANTIASWSWDFGDQSGTSTQQHPNYTYLQDGSYTVTLDLVTNNGCTNTVSIPLTVFPVPVIDISTLTPSGCSEWCVNLINNTTINSGTVDNYFWNLGNGLGATDFEPSPCYINTSDFPVSYDVSLTAISDNGCSSAVTVNDMITVYPNPNAEFSFGPQPADLYNTTIDFLNESDGATIYNWNFDNLGTSQNENPQYTFPNDNPGTYEVCLMVENDYSCMDTICHDVIIDDVFIVYVPNAFTPDGDGYNDEFYAVIDGHDPASFELLVFDRWGELIWQTESEDGRWNGSVKGVSNTAMQDVYVWKLKVKDTKGQHHDYIGHVTLLR